MRCWTELEQYKTGENNGVKDWGKLIVGIVIGGFLYGCCLTQKEALVVQDGRYDFYKSVAKVQVVSKKNPTRVMLATGFAIDRKRIMTAGHFCVEAAKLQEEEIVNKNIQMMFVNNNDELFLMDGLKIVALDREMDVCVLEKRGHGLIPLRFSKKYERIRIGDRVTAVGAPLGMFPVKTEGRVVAPKAEGLNFNPLNDRLVVSTPVTSGSSGSPVLNEHGRVVGMVVMVAKGFNHISFAVRTKMIKKFLKMELGLKYQ